MNDTTEKHTNEEKLEEILKYVNNNFSLLNKKYNTLENTIDRVILQSSAIEQEILSHLMAQSEINKKMLNERDKRGNQIVEQIKEINIKIPSTINEELNKSLNIMIPTIISQILEGRKSIENKITFRLIFLFNFFAIIGGFLIWLIIKN